jgi:hypothetical protein
MAPSFEGSPLLAIARMAELRLRGVVAADDREEL